MSDRPSMLSKLLSRRSSRPYPLFANLATEPGVGKRIHDVVDPRCKTELSFFEILSLPPDLATLCLH